MSYFLYITLIMLSIADYWTTFIILSNGGVEKNPVVKWFIGKFGIKIGVIAVKAIPLSVMGVLVWLYPSEVVDCLMVLVGLYMWAVWHNAREVW